MPKLPTPVTIHISARKLCRRQQRPSLTHVRRRLSDGFVLWLHRGQLKKTVRTVKGERATRALERSQPMGKAMPREVERIMLKARMHLDMLIKGAVPDADEETHDYLCHVVGIAQIRVCDIGLTNRMTGGIETANDLLVTLNAAAQGLLRARQRHEKAKRWGLDGPAIKPLREALDIYETIMEASSAMQMEQAQTVRLDKLKKQQAERAGAAA